VDTRRTRPKGTTRCELRQSARLPVHRGAEKVAQLVFKEACREIIRDLDALVVDAQVRAAAYRDAANIRTGRKTTSRTGRPVSASTRSTTARCGAAPPTMTRSNPMIHMRGV